MEGYEPFGSRIFHGCDLGFKCIESIWIMCTRIGTMRTCSAQKLIEDGCVCVGRMRTFWSKNLRHTRMRSLSCMWMCTETVMCNKRYGRTCMRFSPNAWHRSANQALHHESFPEAAIGRCMDRKVRILPGGRHWKGHGPKGPHMGTST
jgi:hypothetical protein